MLEILASNDCDLLAELNEEIQLFHHLNYPHIFKPYDKESIINFFKTTLTNENTISLIAKENETVLGYALLVIVNISENPFQYERKYILIDQLLVLGKHRLKGIGKQLLDASFSVAKSNKINIIELNHWSANTSARIFFHKCGFEYYNEKMWKTIL